MQYFTLFEKARATEPPRERMKLVQVVLDEVKSDPQRRNVEPNGKEEKFGENREKFDVIGED